MIHWESLIAALAMVESGGDPQAINPREQAYGLYQMRGAALQDANEHFGTHYRLRDCWDVRIAEKMLLAYLARWKCESSDEKAARVWNGGPRGHLKRSTLEYWGRVSALMRAGGCEPSEIGVSCGCAKQDKKLECAR